MNGFWEAIKVQSGSHKTIRRCYTDSCQPTLAIFCAFLLIFLLVSEHPKKANFWHLVCFVKVNWFLFFRKTLYNLKKY